jgi:acyl-CoA thioester hydrolase
MKTPPSSDLQAEAAVRVRYAETDQMGVAYHANYFAWFEVARCELLRRSGTSYAELERQEGISLPVIEARCEYLQPSRYDEELVVRATGHRPSPARLAFDYEVVRASDNTMLARGRTVHAAITRSGRPCRLPERIRLLFR